MHKLFRAFIFTGGTVICIEICAPVISKCSYSESQASRCSKSFTKLCKFTERSHGVQKHVVHNNSRSSRLPMETSAEELGVGGFMKWVTMVE